MRTNHLLQAEIGARKHAVSGLQSDAEKLRSDLLALLNSAHQANHLTEIKLQQLQTKLEQNITTLTSELQVLNLYIRVYIYIYTRSSRNVTKQFCIFRFRMF